MEDIEQTAFPESRHKMYGPARYGDILPPEAGSLLLQDSPPMDTVSPSTRAFAFKCTSPPMATAFPMTRPPLRTMTDPQWRLLLHDLTS